MVSETEEIPVRRIQDNVLAVLERRLLVWLCPRMPAWATPDGMTALGFAGALVIAAGYALSNHSPAWLWLSVVGYIVHWFGDSLDGNIARFRGIERPSYGYFIDHSTDALATLIFVGAIGLSPYMRIDIALIAVCGYMLLSIHAFLAAKVMGEFRLSYLSGGPTELRLMLIMLTIGMLALGVRPSFIPGLSIFDVFGLVVTAILITLFIVQTLSTATILARKGD